MRRQLRTSVDNASKHTLNDDWSAERKDALSETKDWDAEAREKLKQCVWLLQCCVFKENLKLRSSAAVQNVMENRIKKHVDQISDKRYVSEFHKDRFQISRAKLPEGCTLVNDRPTTVQHNTEERPRRSKKQKKEYVANWHEEKTRLQEARQKRRFFEVSPQDADDLKMNSDARENIETCVAASMLCIPKDVFLGETCSFAEFPTHRDN